MSLLDARQMRLFARAVERISGGRVMLPAVTVPREEARALWDSLVQAFAKDGDGHLALVSDLEAARFARFIERLSQGTVRGTGLPTMSRAAMFALLAAARRIEQWKTRFAVRRPGVRPILVAGAVAAATQLAACSTLLGGNVKGNFSCSAPDGSCAPSTVIDDQALAVIQNARPMTPAGPYFQPPAGARQQSAAIAAAAQPDAVAGNGLVHRDRRVLRVVFPSYVDGRGNVHEPRIVHTVVDRGGWMQVSQGSPTVAEQVIGAAGASGSAAATPIRVTALDSAAMAPVDLQGWSLSAGASETGGAVPSPTGVPNAAAVEAARARGVVSANPLEDIRSRVQARLGSVSPLPAGSTEPAPKPPGEAQALPSEPASKSAAAASAGPVNAPASFPAKVEE